MKGLIKFLSAFLLVGFLFGCQGQKAPRPLCRVVTRIDIVCQSESEPLQRRYTDEEKMRAVLLYLRLLRVGRPPEEDPDTVTGDVYKITVTLSDGVQRFYTLKDHRFFQKGTNGWLSIPPTQAADLYRLMWFYDSDA